MSDEPKVRGPWDALAGLIPDDLREIVGVLIVFFIFIAIFTSVEKLPKYFDSLVDSPTKQKCWSLKDVRGIPIKFNQCTGETSKVDIKISPEQPLGSTDVTQPMQTPSKVINPKK